MQREKLLKCSEVIIKIITTTGLDDKDKIVEIAKIMLESAKIDNDYTPDMIEAYSNTLELLKKMDNRDFKKLVDIARR